MRNKLSSLCLLALLAGSGICRADFKYVESVEISGGLMEGLANLCRAYSSQTFEPALVTRYLKGNRLRIERSNGRVQIIDLEAKKFYDIDTQKKTYSVLMFDELEAALKTVQEKLDQGGIKLVPRMETSVTDNFKTLRAQQTHEVKMSLEMKAEVQGDKAQDPKPPYFVSSDLWIAEAGPGFDEISKFYGSLAEKLNWVPGTTFTGDPEMAQAMVELAKGIADLKGFPLSQHVVVALPAPPPPPVSAQAQKPAPPQPAPAEAPAQGGAKPPAGAAETALTALVPQVAVAKTVVGLLGRYQKNKKQAAAAQQQQSQTAQQPAPTATPPPAVPEKSLAARVAEGKPLAEVTIEVTSFSSGTLNAALFKAPPGYKMVKVSAAQVLGEKEAEKPAENAAEKTGEKEKAAAKPGGKPAEKTADKMAQNSKPDGK